MALKKAHKEKPLSDLEVTCSNCKACCCRLEAMLFGDPEVPDHLTVTDERGVRSMARKGDGWCTALDRKTMSCTIYEKRPWICREFEMGKDECLSARADSL
jgi:Fe-S-cluster containining protein